MHMQIAAAPVLLITKAAGTLITYEVAMCKHAHKTKVQEASTQVKAATIKNRLRSSTPHHTACACLRLSELPRPFAPARVTSNAAEH